MRTSLRYVQQNLDFLEERITEYSNLIERYEKEYRLAEQRDEKRAASKIKKLQSRIDELEAQVGIQTTSFDNIELEAIAKARTVAIFESILFAIENWATDDVPASDFTPVAQALLFKAVYDPIMTGIADYYLDEIPFSAYEVVKRGREYVKGIRAETQVPLTEMSVTAQAYQQWWINDALVLIYGDRDPDWEVTKPYTREEMELWKSTDMDKTMNFPRIFDAFDLTRKYGDEIRETSGLPNFTKTIMQTRLTANE
ncbi:MAG: hypothetical protein VXX91_05750 [Planctomycetota bacterium]|nr:hypothetical protein [Planctomycetota bacterium]